MYNARMNGALNNKSIESETEMVMINRDCERKLMELKARIREESDHLSSSEDPVINITITLGSELPSPPSLRKNH